MNLVANDPQMHSQGLRQDAVILPCLDPSPTLTPEGAREDLLGVGEVGVAPFAGEDLAPA